jgi:hypothetical protein
LVARGERQGESLVADVVLTMVPKEALNPRYGSRGGPPKEELRRMVRFVEGDATFFVTSSTQRLEHTFLT